MTLPTSLVSPTLLTRVGRREAGDEAVCRSARTARRIVDSPRGVAVDICTARRVAKIPRRENLWQLLHHHRWPLYEPRQLRRSGRAYHQVGIQPAQETSSRDADHTHRVPRLVCQRVGEAGRDARASSALRSRECRPYPKEPTSSGIWICNSHRAMRRGEVVVIAAVYASKRGDRRSRRVRCYLWLMPGSGSRSASTLHSERA